MNNMQNPEHLFMRTAWFTVALIAAAVFLSLLVIATTGAR